VRGTYQGGDRRQRVGSDLAQGLGCGPPKRLIASLQRFNQSSDCSPRGRADFAERLRRRSGTGFVARGQNVSQRLNRRGVFRCVPEGACGSETNGNASLFQRLKQRRDSGLLSSIFRRKTSVFVLHRTV